MPDSNPANVVLPSFKDTFSDILRLHPVDPQQRASPPSSSSLHSGEPSYSSERYQRGETSRSPLAPSAAMHGGVPAYAPAQSPYDEHRRLGQDAHTRIQRSPIAYPVTANNNPSYYDQGHRHEPASRGGATLDRMYPSAQDMSEGVRTRKRHVCSVCDKDFLRPSSLETHMNSHTGAKPHKCTFPGCDKCFSAKSNMKRHLRKHYSPDDSNQDGNSDEFIEEDEP